MSYVRAGLEWGVVQAVTNIIDPGEELDRFDRKVEEWLGYCLPVDISKADASTEIINYINAQPDYVLNTSLGFLTSTALAEAYPCQ